MSNKSKDDFRICVGRLIEANKSYWGNGPKIGGEKGWIYVLHTLHHEFTTSVREDIVAKGFQEKTHLPIISVISGRADELMSLMEQVDASFGVEQSVHPSYYDYDSEEIQELAKEMASATYGKKDGLIGLTYRGIQFGDVIYDDILRRGNNKKRGDVFDCFNVSQERYCTFIRNALAIIDQAYQMFEKRKPRYLVTTEYFYTKGLYAHVAYALGAKILITSVKCPDVIVQVNPGKGQLSDVKIADTLRTQTEKCLQIFQDNSQNLKSFSAAGSENRGTERIPERAGKRKNVLILPHIFSDVPREACRHNVYYDYREWYLDTIRIIRDIPDVNWIVKEHPWAFYYKQENYVRSVFEENKTENMYWLDKDCSGINVSDFVDCVLTCAGTAGIEYWACGIPTITAGEAFYCNWGISYQMKSLEEYEAALRNIGKFGSPSRESKELAAKYLSADKKRYDQSDLLSKFLCDYWMKESAIWKKTGNHYGVDNDTDQQLESVFSGFCENFILFLQNDSLKQSNIYQLNNLVEL